MDKTTLIAVLTDFEETYEIRNIDNQIKESED